MRTAINAIIIEDKKILLVQKKETWILPGGKPDANDSNDISTLMRECHEELSGTKIKNITPYKTFIGQTPHAGDQLEARTYFAQIDGKLGNPSAEIKQSMYVDSSTQLNLSDITEKIIFSLKKDEYIR